MYALDAKYLQYIGFSNSSNILVNTIKLQ